MLSSGSPNPPLEICDNVREKSDERRHESFTWFGHMAYITKSSKEYIFFIHLDDDTFTIEPIMVITNTNQSQF
jgi:hypothetical protein